MCFSATASFAASAVLGVLGVVALKKTVAPAQVLFAGIPLIFAVQQFTEGLVWLSLTHPEYAGWESGAVRAFLFVAEVLWPVWVPWSILLFDHSPQRRRPLQALTGLGLLVSLYMGYYLVYFSVRAEIGSHHIHYVQYIPLAKIWYSGLFYFIPTVVPLLISNIKSMWIMGLSLLASYIVSHLFYTQYVTSVWCFFAAILSVEVLWIIWESPKSAAFEKAIGIHHP